MGLLSDTSKARLDGRSVKMARLVELDFSDGTGRYWEGGTGTLAAGGYEWTGTGELSTISGIETAVGFKAPVVTLGLSGVSAANVARMLSAETSVKDRPASIFLQFYDEATLAALDQPYPIFTGLMDVMAGKLQGPSSSSITLTIESYFTGRARPPWGWLSTRSQQALFAGDRGLDNLPDMENTVMFWPVY